MHTCRQQDWEVETRSSRHLITLKVSLEYTRPVLKKTKDQKKKQKRLRFQPSEVNGRLYRFNVF